MRSGYLAYVSRAIWALLIAFSFTSTLRPASAAERYASFVIEADTGRVLHQVNADELRYPASLTKMMTAYLTFEALRNGALKLNQPLPVSKHATEVIPSKLGVLPGQTITVEQAVLGIAIKSANDAAIVLAEAIGGTERDFARMMTQRARQLGMTRTTFANAHGLPNLKQVTTARDMATLAQALLRDYPRQYRYFSTEEFTFNGATLRNHDHLLGKYEGADGIKTGFTGRSGFNLVSSAVRDGKRVIAVIFGGQSARTRDAHMVDLLDDGFRSIEIRTANAAQPVKPKIKPEPDEEAPATIVAAAATQPASTPAKKPKVFVNTPAPAVEVEQGDTVDGPTWGIQVGAFKSASQAKHAVADAKRHDRALLANARIDLSVAKTSEGRMHRARFVGLTETQSRAACRALKQQKQICVPVSPTGQLVRATSRAS
ncbi:MAG: serine hydrolase [Proteobacteria bacterium]|nr:serine hydrolase [Pseudomonadota bacterium]MBI3498015.1 serine hydrolase [Pseudomonadota bacterium]